LDEERTNILKFFLLTLLLVVLTASNGAASQQTGWIQMQLPSLPEPDLNPPLLSEKLNPQTEFFEIYVPPDYDPARSYGVLAWVNPHDSAEIPRQFEGVLSKYGLVAVSAQRIGNNKPWQRRIGVLESAVVQLSQTIHLDSARRIMSGFSGGGRTAALACFLHPDFWKGAISWAGGNFYKTYSIPMPVGAYASGINDAKPGTVSAANVKKSRHRNTFVLITGSKDFNQNDSRGIYRALKNDGFRALLLDERGLGHEVGSADLMIKALDFMLEKSKKD
jgi:hypothetical protein